MDPIFQVGGIVENLDEAMAELSQARAVQWGIVGVRKIEDANIKRVLSRDGPPYLELIEGPAGSGWDRSKGSRIDHIQWWSDEMEADRRKLKSAGLTVEIDGVAMGQSFRYFKAPASGMRIELIDAA